MSEAKRIKTALVSVYHKEGLNEIITKLHEEGVQFLSTGGTRQFIESLGYPCQAVEDLTTYPSILGGRVKTLHPKVFGGILCRRGLEQDIQQIEKYGIPEIDLVIVDLYPFEATVASGACEADVIEKIDIGGISLIRAAAKNYNDVVIVASQAQYQPFRDMLTEHGATTTLEERRWLAKEAFAVSSNYDSAIFNYFDGEEGSAFRYSANDQKALRYGENPHQKGYFYGNLDAMFDQIHGKEISYNNLLDINAAVDLIDEFEDTTFAILKHNNACGLASRPTLLEAWKDALAGDPVSAFGGVLVANRVIDKETAEEINKIFFEVIIAPDYDVDALEVLGQKKNRIILVRKPCKLPKKQFRSLLNGVLVQERDLKIETPETGDRQAGHSARGGGHAFCQQNCEKLQVQLHCAGQGQAIVGQRRGPDQPRGCLEAGHRKGQELRLRPARGCHGKRCFLPLPRLRRDSRQRRHHGSYPAGWKH